jgi:hypothetical protein
MNASLCLFADVVSYVFNLLFLVLVSGPLSPSITTPLSPLDLSLQEQRELGYMPLRDDFERVRKIRLGIYIVPTQPF